MKIVVFIVASVWMLGCSHGARPVSSVPVASHTDVPLDEVRVITLARQAVSQIDTWADRATYEVSRAGSGWSVFVWRIEGYDQTGKPQFTPGGHRVVKIDEHGQVTAYFRGR